MTQKPKKIILAITGASGCVYGLRLLEEMLSAGIEVDLVVSDPGRYVLERECQVKLSGDLAADAQRLKSRVGGGALVLHSNDDFTSPISSGSSMSGSMVIAPCTMGTAGRVARGISSSLIERAADVTLKEGRRLVVVPRETPLSAIHLENLLALARAGAIVLPPSPGFYGKADTVEDLVNFVVGKVLDVLGIEHSLLRRWEGVKEKG